jgi:hypothetical protein
MQMHLGTKKQKDSYLQTDLMMQRVTCSNLVTGMLTEIEKHWDFD